MKRLPIAIVGLNFGRLIVDQIVSGQGKKYFELAAVCDLDRAKAETLARRHRCKAYTSLDALLADPAIPVIGLFSGPVGRAELLRKIIRAGKDVMTTKPFEVDPAAALDILREAKRRKRVIHLNSPAPVLSADMEQLARWREEFDLGRPIGARAESWGSYREKADGTWYDDAEKCPVAPIFRLGIYLINDLVHFFGEPRDVQVFHERIFTGRPTPDNAQLAIRFKKGGLASIFNSLCVDDLQHYRNSLVLNFERGTVYRNAGPFPCVPGNEGVARLAIVTRRGTKPVVRRRTIKGGLSGLYQWGAFHRAIRGELAEAVAPEETVAGLRVIVAMARAEKSGRAERV